MRLQGALADQVEAAKAQRQDLEKLQQVGGADSEGRLVALEHAALGSGGGGGVGGEGELGVCVWRDCDGWLLETVLGRMLASCGCLQDCLA